MDLDSLEALPSDDQWTFVRGRIVETSVALDAALRGLHAQLRGLDSVEALLAAPQNWTHTVEQCRTSEGTQRSDLETSSCKRILGRKDDLAYSAPG